jgi:hypothetical protein
MVVSGAVIGKPLSGLASLFHSELFFDPVCEVIINFAAGVSWYGGLLSVVVGLQVIPAVLDYYSVSLQPPYKLSLLHCTSLLCCRCSYNKQKRLYKQAFLFIKS